MLKVQSLMIAAIPNIIGWLAISFAKVSKMCSVFPLLLLNPNLLPFMIYPAFYRTHHSYSWEGYWKVLALGSSLMW